MMQLSRSIFQPQYKHPMPNYQNMTEEEEEEGSGLYLDVFVCLDIIIRTNCAEHITNLN